jgi:hypothetical protein
MIHDTANYDRRYRGWSGLTFPRQTIKNQPMKILTTGHKYIAANFENKENGQTIQFIEKRPTEADNTVFETVNDGTTNEELIAILLDRLNVMNAKFPCRENALAVTKLQEALFWLNHRTSERLKRNVEGKNLA